MAAEPPRRVQSLFGDRVGLRNQDALDLLRRLLLGLAEAAFQSLERGEEVDRGRPRRGEDVPRGLEALRGARRRSAPHRERGAVGRRHADRRRAANSHLADGDCHLRRLLEGQPDLVCREEPLVEEAEQRAFAVNGEQDLRQRDPVTTSAAPPDRGSATAVNVPSGPRAIA